ncbi:MAG: threonine ammonia-lyase IlvA [Propionibacteriaceae bacterium]|nr:threonine ammonia-lyase IlvA [Propionibacteriaceae bacterium]
MDLLADLAAAVPAALARLSGVTNLTPLDLNDRLSRATGCQVWLKREDLQPVRSYKLRGAYNLMSQLGDREREAGVVCASAGNHGQGVAWSCARLGVQGRIFVPTTTPRQKRERMLDLGRGHIELIVTGDNYDQAAAAADEAALLSGATKVPAFDDMRTAAGQATVMAEIVEQLGGAPDVVLIPVGGGGMLAGCAAWLRQFYPKTRIIGVEPDGAACMIAAMNAGYPVTLPKIETFVDGAAVARAGAITYPIVRLAAPELVRVQEGQICQEMLALYQTDGIIAEPAGAMASAVLPTGAGGSRVQIPAGSTVVAIVSGGNNDVLRYPEIVERALVHEGRKRYLLVEFPQEPGALRRFLDEVLGPDDDITYFEYVKRNNRDTGPAMVGVELGDPRDFPALLERLQESRIQVEIITSDSPFYRFLV